MAWFWFYTSLVADPVFFAVGAYAGYKYGSRAVAVASSVTASATAVVDAVKKA